MRRDIERYLSRFSYPIFLTYAISYGRLSWVASILPGTIAIRQTEGTCRLGPEGAIQLQLTDGFASFTDENYETRGIRLSRMSVADRPPLYRASPSSRSRNTVFRARIDVALHTPGEPVYKMKANAREIFSKRHVSPLSFIGTCKNVWHVYALAPIYTRSRCLFLESLLARKSEIVKKLRNGTQLQKKQKRFVRNAPFRLSRLQKYSPRRERLSVRHFSLRVL